MNFGFVSTRFAGTDGVSLESLKWAEVLERAGHSCYWFSGLSDRPEEVSHVVPESHFTHPMVEDIAATIWNLDSLPPETAEAITSLRSHLHLELTGFVDRFAIDVLVPQNAITIPMNLPLGLAITDLIRGTKIPTLAHHHDFYWERERFSGKAALPYLVEAFPPHLPEIAHAVIHTGAARDLYERFGIAATLVPNVMDFESLIPARRSREELRELLSIDPEDHILLQPTRVVPRKGIEHAIELAYQLGDPRVRLIVSHEAGDEGLDYQRILQDLATKKGVDLRFSEKHDLTLAEWYDLADLVTFPSLYEGFGNALLEAVRFRKPVLVNRYPVFRSDIEPLGFDFVMMDGSIVPAVVDEVRAILTNPRAFDGSIDRNFRIGAEHFGYPTLETRISEMLHSLGLSLRGPGYDPLHFPT